VTPNRNEALPGAHFPLLFPLRQGSASSVTPGLRTQGPVSKAGRPADLKGATGDNATAEQEATTMAFPGPLRHDRRYRRPTTVTGHGLVPVAGGSFW
jgi:hypothetical protein